MGTAFATERSKTKSPVIFYLLHLKKMETYSFSEWATIFKSKLTGFFL